METVLQSATAVGHISMMHDTLIANLLPSDLRAIVRALITQGIGSSTVAARFAQLARERCSLPKANETPADAHQRARLLFSAGEAVLALDLLARLVVPQRRSLCESEHLRLDHDIVQGIQSAREAHLEGSQREKEAASALSGLRNALEKARKEDDTTFLLERSLSAAFSWSPSFCPPPTRLHEDGTLREGDLFVPPTGFETFRLGLQDLPRIFCGLWQLSSPSWGTAPSAEISSALQRLATNGFTAFDMADHYGDAEVILGNFRSTLAQPNSIYAATKWCVFKPLQISQETVRTALQERKARLRSVPDLVQFHWQHWRDELYKPALRFMLDLRKEGLLRGIGLCNFDAAKTAEVCSALPEGSIVSNQVQFSLVDSRPLFGMCDVCLSHDIKLLTYGSLCGGFLADRWLGKPDPDVYSPGFTPSLRKYRDMIGFWGGWDLFQTLLQTLRDIATRHRVSIANVATRWVLQQPAVGAVIIGVRLGLSNNADDNARVFDFRLDAQDMAAIAAVIRQSNARKMISAIGDCGDEYR